MTLDWRFNPLDWRIGIYVEPGWFAWERFHVMLQIPMVRLTWSVYREEWKK